MITRTLELLVCCMTLYILPLGGQQPVVEEPLGTAYRTYAEQFTDIGYALPLADGSLMISDFGEMTLWRLDGRTGAALPVGRKGLGPQEYQVVGQLLRLPGDTVAMYDAAQARMLLVTAAGEPVRTITLTSNRLELLRLPQSFATDARGRIYAHVFAPPSTKARDSARSYIDVVRLPSLTSARYDTLTRLWFEHLPSVHSTSPATQVLRVRVNLTSLYPSDAALVRASGELVVLRGDRYRVEFVDASGVTQREVQVTGATYPLTREEREALVQRTRDGTAKGTAHARRLLDAQVPMPPVVIEEPDEWPAQKPFFRPGARISDNGRLHVPVDCAVPGRQCLDVLNADGVRRVRYRLPTGARFLTASDQFLFLALRDADDLETVRAYRAP